MKLLSRIIIATIFYSVTILPQSVSIKELNWGSVSIEKTSKANKLKIRIDAPQIDVQTSSNLSYRQIESVSNEVKSDNSYNFYYAIPAGATIRINNPILKLREINPTLDQIATSYYITSDSTLVQTQYKSVIEAVNLIGTQPLNVEGYVWFRGYRLACINVAPYFKQGDNVVALESVEADFIIENASQSTNSLLQKSDPHFDNVLKSVISNYDEAKTYTKTTLNWNDTTGNWFTPGMMALKLGIPQDGIYRLTYNDLVSAGVPVAQVNPKTFRLLNRGKEIPILVQTTSEQIFSSGDYIEFAGRRNYGLKDYRTIATGNEEYAEYLNRYTDTSMYWLVWGGENGLRVSTNNGIQVSGDTLDWYTEVLHIEKDNFLQFINSSTYTVSQDPQWQHSDIWGMGWLNGGSTYNQTFSANNISNKYDSAKIFARFSSWGGTSVTPTHRVRLRVNNSDTLQRIDLNRFQHALMTGSAGITNLINGTNTIRLHSLTTASIPNALLIDWFDVEYPRNLTTTDSLIFSFRMIDSTKVRGIRISGLTTQNVVLYKMSPVPKRITDIAFSGTSSFTLVFFDTVANGDTYILLSAQKIKNPIIRGLRQFGYLRDINQQSDYLLITHKRFLNTAQSYVSYISSMYNLVTKIVDVDDIFDQFGYGYPTAESIREFIKSTTRWEQPFPAYLCIVGDATYDYKYVLADPNPANRPFNAVPSYGQPVSDPYLTTVEDLSLPQMYVGRIPANTNEEFQRYYSRLQKYNAEKNDDWNKRYIFFAGGDPNVTGQVEQFKAVNDDIIATYIKPAPVGGLATSFYKTKNPQSDFGLYEAEYIRDVIDNGGVFISYIGHSGTATWDNGIGDPIQLKNKREKYALVSDFGCSTCKFAESNIKCFGELFTVGETGSAIAYIGNSALGLVSFAVTLPKAFSKEILLNNIKSIGEAHYLGKFNLIRTSGGMSSAINRIMMYTNTLLGDPVLNLAIPQMPNLSIKNSNITSSQLQLTDDAKYANIVIPYVNTGRVTNDTVLSKFSYTYFGVNNDTILTHIMPYFYDTLNVKIPIEERSGDYQLSIELNTDKKINEIEYSDNTATSLITVLSSSFRQLNPLPYFEQKVNKITLLNPARKPTDETGYVELELSTNDNFQNSQLITKELGKVSTDFPVSITEEGKKHYWRAGFKNSAKRKATGEFIPQNTEKLLYRQFDSLSWSKSDLKDITFSNSGLRISEKIVTIRLTSSGGNDGAFGAVEIDGFNVLPNTFTRGHSIVILDTVNISAKSVRHFDNSNAGSTAWADSLKAFIDRLPIGEVVMDVVIFDGSLNFTQAARNALKSIGASSYIDSLANRDSYAIIGRKGAAPGTVKEVFKRTFTGKAIIDTFYLRKLQNGTVVSPIIGPVGIWDTVKIKRNLPTGSMLTTSIYGINAFGQSDTIISNNTDSVISLTNISATQYPKLQIAANFNANSKLESPILTEWSVTVQPPSELAINYQSISVTSDSILEGDSVPVSIEVYNVSSKPSENVNVVLSELRRGIIVDSTIIPIISGNTSKKVSLLYSTVGRRGDNILHIQVDSRNQIPEIYKTNNSYTVPIYVINDTTKPTFDITFDGQRIYDGDYVLPNPTIKINIYDNSPLMIQNPSSVKLFLDNRQIMLGSYPDSLFEVKPGPEKATVTFKPKLSGRKQPYKLYLEVTDSSNNKVSLPDPLTFRIDSVTNIKNVFNYPNPFAEKTHFTFILTNYADDITIKIYTIAGRLIKEIKVPIQSSPYYHVYWDGRDQDGDEIANGIYFYKIIAKYNNELKEVIQKLAKIK